MKAASYLILLLLLLPVFLMFSRGRRFRAQQAKTQGSLSEGDEIMTRGGVFGTVRDVRDDVMWVEIAPDVVVRFHRQAVAQIIVDRSKSEPAAVGAGGTAEDVTETTG